MPGKKRQDWRLASFYYAVRCLLMPGQSSLAPSIDLLPLDF
jgi:hypothetical protein